MAQRAYVGELGHSHQLVSPLFAKSFAGLPPLMLLAADGAAAVASFLAAVLAEIYLCNVCSCQEMLRRNGRGQRTSLSTTRSTWRRGRCGTAWRSTWRCGRCGTAG
jgi:hypothetical protein